MVRSGLRNRIEKYGGVAISKVELARIALAAKVAWYF